MKYCQKKKKKKYLSASIGFVPVGFDEEICRSNKGDGKTLADILGPAHIP